MFPSQPHWPPPSQTNTPPPQWPQQAPIQWPHQPLQSQRPPQQFQFTPSPFAPSSTLQQKKTVKRLRDYSVENVEQSFKRLRCGAAPWDREGGLFPNFVGGTNRTTRTSTTTTTTASTTTTTSDHSDSGMEDGDDGRRNVVFTSTIPDFPYRRPFEPSSSAPSQELRAAGPNYPLTVYRDPSVHLNPFSQHPRAPAGGVSGTICGLNPRLQLSPSLVVELLDSDGEDDMIADDDDDFL